MTASDILWMFFALSALQPVLQQRFLEASRRHLIAKIERQRKSRVILLVHRQETMSILGFPVLRHIDVNDSEEVLRAIRLTDPVVPLDIVLHTPGGLVLEPPCRLLARFTGTRGKSLPSCPTMPCLAERSLPWRQKRS